MIVSKSGFYQWLSCKDKNLTHLVKLEEEIKKIHTSSRGTYGRRRVLSTLKKSFIHVGKKRVSKIMRKLDLWGVGKPKFKVTTNVNKKAIHSPN
jgi:putative transposase